MPGFFVSNIPSAGEPVNRYPHRCLRESLEVPGMTVERNTLRSFSEDKAFARLGNAVVVSAHTGEGIEDLDRFRAEDFARNLLNV